MRRGLIITVIAVFALVAALAGWWCLPNNTNPAQYHLRQIRSLRSSMGFAPQKWKDYFRPTVWRWYLRGKPAPDQIFKQVESHRDALIQLGYFQQREFVLNRRHLDSVSRKELQTLLGKAPFACHDWEYSTAGVDPINALTVTTTPADMKIWSNVIATFDAKVVK